MKVVVAVAPHPDDETLGCGGTILRHVERGDEVHWLIASSMRAGKAFSEERIARRDAEIAEVARTYGFSSVTSLPFEPAGLDSLPMGEIVKAVGAEFGRMRPQILYIPNRGDAHTDHRVVFDACASCTKWFRYPSLEGVYAYETLSESDVTLQQSDVFRPNHFVEITDFLEKKLEIMKIFESEVMPFPFPRSMRALTALADLRGSQCGVTAAEAFMMLRSIARG